MDCKLTQIQINYIIKNLSPKIVETPKNCLINQEKSNFQICIILSGMVYLCAENGDGDRSILRYFSRGDYFTHNMLIPVDDGVIYYVTKSKATIAYVNRSDILRFWQNNSDVNTGIIDTIFSISEYSTSLHSYILHQKKVRNKLMTYFNNEVKLQKSNTITVPIPLSDLCEYLAVERTAMMKELRKLKDDGLITGKNRKLTIITNS